MPNTKKTSSAQDALLSSAEVLFAERGYAAVSTRELAEHAGVNLGSITYHFGSKAQLFVSTIHQMMSKRNEHLPQLLDERDQITATDAAAHLAEFIEKLLFDICHPQGPDACRIMHREILGEASEDPEMFEALVSSVVRDFIRPIDTHLLALVTAIRPNSSAMEKTCFVQSIIGQCSFYVTSRPFMNRLREGDITEPKQLSQLAGSIARFTLRGLGLNEEEIERACTKKQK